MSYGTSRTQRAYEQALQSGTKEPDPAQTRAVRALGRLERELMRRRLPWRQTAPTGVFLYGPVGRGKTWLMDLFYRALPFEDKLRSHFHRFMLEEVHAPLRRLRHQRDPLPRLARDLARRSRVLCFDELLVEDIADAMLLGPLLQGLFDHGVALVTTANVPPAGLYRDGLKRDRFLPTIASLEQHCELMNVGGGQDYRTQHLGAGGTYRITQRMTGRAELQALFTELTGEGAHDGTIHLSGRPVAVGGVNQDTVFLEFGPLCEEARSAADYVELAERYRTVLLAGLPVLDDYAPQATRRFIALVDVLYERRTVLILTAEAEPDALYRGERFRFEFRRTASRLEEMRSKAYLSATHLAHIPMLTPL